MPDKLPILALREEFERLDCRRVVISATTGSGKSTQVPRWCSGRVLIVEPRRVACRTLAQRVAELEGTTLGKEIGYQVRDERRAVADTRVLFATPGIVLQRFEELLQADTVILDEFHERRQDVDLLLALFRKRYPKRLVVMSATLDGDQVARALDGVHLHTAGRTFEVDVRYLPGKDLLPDLRGLEQRLGQAMEAAANDPGDVLVFLPGKAEIASCADALRSRRDLTVIPLHGDLSLEQQNCAFRPAAGRKVILSTNVAETSVTIPGIGVVIDSGLVRQTRYHQGRGFLTLVPIAMDSAEQRRGRAGRTAPGVCYRLWNQAARLAAVTSPEVHRESLVPLLLAAAAWGEPVEALPFLDPPKAHAIESAREELQVLGALDAEGRMTARGRAIFGLPLDASLGRLIVEAERRGCLEDVIDLVAVLGVGRPLFRGPPREEDDLRAVQCDALACIRALRVGNAEEHGLVRFTLDEARRVSTRLRRAFDLPVCGKNDAKVDRKKLAMTAIAADPRCAHVARRRGRRTSWSNGGTELELGRESAVATGQNVEAIAVLETRALGRGAREKQVVITSAMPIEVKWLVEAGLGRDRTTKVKIKNGRVVAEIERVYARRALETRVESPHGSLAREAIRELFLRGSLWRETLEMTRERLEAAALAHRLADKGEGLFGDPQAIGGAPPDLEDWVLERLQELGVETGDDLVLLSAQDLLAPDLAPELRSVLDREYPRSVKTGDAEYSVTYDLDRCEVTLHKLRGQRREPPAAWQLPRFRGLRVRLEERGAVRTIRLPE